MSGRAGGIGWCRGVGGEKKVGGGARGLVEWRCA